MTTLRQFTCDDLFRFNGINLDPLTEMYGLSFYLQVPTLPTFVANVEIM